MIDNIKTFVIDKHGFENHILDNVLMDLTNKVNCITGELLEFPKRGKDLNLEINITKNQSTILGSIHKYQNILDDLGRQNYNDFSFCQIQEVIQNLIDKYKIKNNTSITNLEFGFNLELTKDPKLIINSNVLMNNFKAPNKNLKYLGNGDYKEFQLSDYSIKIYNKSKQYKQETNILRVELKITRKRLLEKLGINQLEDLLNCWAYVKLFKDFIDKFEQLLIVDRFDVDLVPENDYNRLIKYTNPNFWIDIKEKKSPKSIYTLKKDFQHLLNKHSLLTTKKEILEKINSKFVQLLNPNYDYLEDGEVNWD
jgi:hypothetical protein